LGPDYLAKQVELEGRIKQFEALVADSHALLLAIAGLKAMLSSETEPSAIITALSGVVQQAEDIGQDKQKAPVNLEKHIDALAELKREIDAAESRLIGTPGFGEWSDRLAQILFKFRSLETDDFFQELSTCSQGLSDGAKELKDRLEDIKNLVAILNTLNNILGLALKIVGLLGLL
jgi:hypothetical protein